jgi:hypothetical protein
MFPGALSHSPRISNSIYVACSDSAFAEQGDADTGLAKSKPFSRCRRDEVCPTCYPGHGLRGAQSSIRACYFREHSYNMKPMNWTWDDNNFRTKPVFAHPYHGNLYYSAFRSNGYTFWNHRPRRWR